MATTADATTGAEDFRISMIWTSAALDDLNLTLEEHRVYAHLNRRAGTKDVCWPSYTGIGEVCFRGSYPDAKPQLLRQKAMSAIKSLAAKGLITVTKRKHTDGNHFTNVYTITEQKQWRVQPTIIVSTEPPPPWARYLQPNTPHEAHLTPNAEPEPTATTSAESLRIDQEMPQNAPTPSCVATTRVVAGDDQGSRGGRPKGNNISKQDLTTERERTQPTNQPAIIIQPRQPTAPKTTKTRIERSLYDPRKFGANGHCPRGKGETAYEVYREAFNVTLTHSVVAIMSETVTDLAKWREITTAWALRGHRSNDIANMLDVYRNGWKNKTGFGAQHDQPTQPNTDDAATYARIMAQRQAALSAQTEPDRTGSILHPV